MMISVATVGMVTLATCSLLRCIWFQRGRALTAHIGNLIQPRFARLMTVGLCVWLSSVPFSQNAGAFDFKDVASIGAAYTTHLFLHETGHQVVAHKVGAAASQMSFFTKKDGKFYPGLSTCENIPEESKLPYAAGGERMAGFTFEYALQSYHHNPTTYNKALMFFSCADFVLYTLLANYVNPDDDAYDPNTIRTETGSSKGVLLGLIMAKSLLNTYRVMNPDANFAPMIWVDETSAALLLRFTF